MNTSISVSDLDQILDCSSSSFMSLNNANILISGASGFVGTWLTSSLLYASNKMDLDLQVTVLVRNQKKLLNRLQEIPKNLKLVEIDYLKKPDIHLKPNYSHIIQSTTPSMPNSGSFDQENVSNVSYQSNEFLLNFAKKHKVPPIFCHLSSGAVYGNPEKLVGPINEQITSDDDSSLSNYGVVKRSLEREIEEASNRGDIRGCNPRLFAFGGPFLQLDAHFAIGNFMQNAILNQPISINGDPSTIRSYLYPTDLISFLLALLNNPTLDPIHIGSSQSITMLELATLFSNLFKLPIEVNTKPQSVFSSYFPSTTKSEKYLGVKQKISIEESLLRWSKWLRN